jgi:hypothetical protein
VSRLKAVFSATLHLQSLPRIAKQERVRRRTGSAPVRSSLSGSHNNNMAACTFLNRIETEAHIPEDDILNRTLYNGEALKVVALGFASGQELFAHTAPMAALLYFVRGKRN